VIDSIVTQLGKAGPAWALTAAVVGLMAWIVRSLLTSWIAERVKLWDFITASTKAQQEIADALRTIRDNCRVCREDSLRTVRDETSEIKRMIEERNSREIREDVRELSGAIMSHTPAPIVESIPAKVRG
jgi:hypothetical protein